MIVLCSIYGRRLQSSRMISRTWRRSLLMTLDNSMANFTFTGAVCCPSRWNTKKNIFWTLSNWNTGTMPCKQSCRNHSCYRIPPFFAVVRPSPTACSFSCSSAISAATSLITIIDWATWNSFLSRSGSCSFPGSNYNDTTMQTKIEYMEITLNNSKNNGIIDFTTRWEIHTSDRTQHMFSAISASSCSPWTSSFINMSQSIGAIVLRNAAVNKH